MRPQPSILHLDLDAFFAAVEQRDKPSLRGKPVVVGGLGPRGVVATASYEARAFGVRSAMRMAEARARCPHAAFLSPRFTIYRRTSRAVMAALRELSPVVEPLSLDEAYVDLTAGTIGDLSPSAVESLARDLKRTVRRVTGGLTASIGVGTSKLIAKIASDLRKPDGLLVVTPGAETELLSPMPVSVIPGVGPATAERLRRMGVHTVGDLGRVGEEELVRALGKAHGQALARLACAGDDRPVVAEREAKSISVEDTFDHDIADPALLGVVIERLASRVCERLARERLSGRTVTVKVRLYDFTTHTRSATLAGPTDDDRVITRLARRLLSEVDTSAGVRLLGVGVSGLADWVQEDLFGALVDETDADAEHADAEHSETERVTSGPVQTGPRWVPGADVIHRRYGAGWVWGSGLGRVTVRFETATTGPGPVRTFASDDPELAPYSPLTPHSPLARTDPPPAG
ncbi:DNA polymerase IV [Thermasporomyces composti]|uniref:DNA polymerase IV n=1 Tax=Thermasporomyces composti TaxID=696763 RepID=A0A3D9V7Z7_THECX|nr:DNA polymerase IV [Thermasporomyces composti]REF37918.1 DNA polymerase-4 [Thermasporomyces composti]